MIRSLQSLRFLFIMLVVFSHIYGKVFDFGGECGVAFFFMLSGFILSYAYGQKVVDGTFRTLPFIKKQLTKFYPLHLLTFAIMVVLDARLGRFYEWYRLLPNALLLQSWFPDDSFFFAANGSSWFLSDLIFFYVVFAVAFRLLTSLSLRRLSLLVLVVLAAYVLLAFSVPLWKVNAVLYASPATRLIDFCVGILCYRFYAAQVGLRLSQWLQRQSPVAVTAVEVALVGVVIASFFVYENMSLRLRCAALFWLYLPLFIVVYAGADKGRGVITALLHHPVMQWLGGISFELYLTHRITMRIFYSFLLPLGIGEEEHIWMSVMIPTLVLIIAVSWMAKRFFTDPVGKYLRKYISKDMK